MHLHDCHGNFWKLLVIERNCLLPGLVVCRVLGSFAGSVTQTGGGTGGFGVQATSCILKIFSSAEVNEPLYSKPFESDVKSRHVWGKEDIWGVEARWRSWKRGKISITFISPVS